MGEGLDPAPQHSNLMTLIPKEGESRSFPSPSRSTPGRWDNAAGETASPRPLGLLQIN